MPVQSVGFIPQGHHPGMTPMQGVVLGARQPQNPPVSASPTVTHSQSMDDGFSGFQKAAPLTSSGGQTKEDDFGEFLHAPSNSGLGKIQINNIIPTVYCANTDNSQFRYQQIIVNSWYHQQSL